MAPQSRTSVTRKHQTSDRLVVELVDLGQAIHPADGVLGRAVVDVAISHHAGAVGPGDLQVRGEPPNDVFERLLVETANQLRAAGRRRLSVALDVGEAFEDRRARLLNLGYLEVRDAGGSVWFSLEL